MLKKLFARKKQETKKTELNFEEKLNHFCCVTSEKAKVVLMQGEMLKRYNKPFIDEEIKVTENGIMIPKVDSDFMRYANKFNKKFKEYINLFNTEQQVVDYVLKKYGNMDALKFNDLVTLKAINTHGLKCKPFTTISNQFIKKVFIDVIYAQEIVEEFETNKSV